MDEAGSVELKLIQLYQSILREAGISIIPQHSILDFGCGEGKLVYQYRKLGYKAFGVDIAQRWGQTQTLCSEEGLESEGVFHLIDKADYRIPFDDDTFDLVHSNQVFEHVQDYSVALRDIKRVLKPGGISLHIFPSKWRPVECHTFVPLGGVLRTPVYLRLWAQLGIRNSFQKGLDYKETANRNAAYLSSCINYLSTAEIRDHVITSFGNCRFAEMEYLKTAIGPSRKLYPVAKLFPFVSKLVSVFHTRVVLFKKT